MIRIERISTFAHEGAGRAQTVYRTVASQPGWITRIALMAFFLIIAMPIVLLLLLALITATVIFGLLAVANALILRLRSLLPRRDDGRENVRVIRRV